MNTFKSNYLSNAAYFSIEELLKRKTVPELRSLALILDLRFKSGTTKETMLDMIADHMIKKPETLIKSAFYYELKAFLDIIREDMSLEFAKKSGFLYELNRFGLIYALDYPNDKISTLNFQMDLADILEPLIPAELERRERDGSLLFEKLALGCANIYGYTEMYYLQDYYFVVGDRVGVKYNDTTLTKAFYPILAAIDSTKKKEQGLLVSPFSKVVNFFPDEEHIRFEITPKKFDFDTILKYGDMPYPQFIGKEADALRETIRKYSRKGYKADDIMRKLWLFHQYSEKNTILPDLDFLEIPDLSVLQPCLDSIKDFMNSVPSWKLAGYSSQEIAKIELESKNNRSDSNKHVMGADTYEHMTEMTPYGGLFMSQPIPEYIKIGRNDPCPCGSGKKYKNCCGRIL